METLNTGWGKLPKGDIIIEGPYWIGLERSRAEQFAYRVCANRKFRYHFFCPTRRYMREPIWKSLPFSIPVRCYGFLVRNEVRPYYETQLRLLPGTIYGCYYGATAIIRITSVYCFLEYTSTQGYPGTAATEYGYCLNSA